MAPLIRPAVATDHDRLHRINEANVPAVSSLTRPRFDDLIAMSVTTLVVEPSGAGEVAGFCVVLGPGAPYGSVNYRWFMDRYDDALYLDRVAVDERYRGLGLGTLLYSELDRLLAAAHPTMARLTLEVNLEPPNPGSLAFHARLGFAEVGRQHTDYGCEVSLQSRPLPSA